MLTKDDPQYATKLGHLLGQYLIEYRALVARTWSAMPKANIDGSATLNVDGICVWHFPADMVREICERYVEPPKPSTALKWRNEPPDKPGWWWMHLNDGDESEVPEVVNVYSRAGSLYVAGSGMSMPLFRLSSAQYRWAGPIQPPVESE